MVIDSIAWPTPSMEAAEFDLENAHKEFQHVKNLSVIEHMDMFDAARERILAARENLRNARALVWEKRGAVWR